MNEVVSVDVWRAQEARRKSPSRDIFIRSWARNEEAKHESKTEVPVAQSCPHSIHVVGTTQPSQTTSQTSRGMDIHVVGTTQTTQPTSHPSRGLDIHVVGTTHAIETTSGLSRGLDIQVVGTTQPNTSTTGHLCESCVRF